MKIKLIVDKIKPYKLLNFNSLYGFEFGEPGGSRTPDTRLRRPVLYPTELLTQIKQHKYDIINITESQDKL